MNLIKQWSALAIVIIFTSICYFLIINSARSVFVEYPLKISQPSKTKPLPISACIDSSGAELPFDIERITEEISKKKSCFQAVKLAENCAWGSLADIQKVSAAADICTNELNKNIPPKELTSLLTNMQNLCYQKYMKIDGTMYRSMSAYCYLSALEWVTDFSASVE